MFSEVFSEPIFLQSMLEEYRISERKADKKYQILRSVLDSDLIKVLNQYSDAEAEKEVVSTDYYYRKGFLDGLFFLLYK